MFFLFTILFLLIIYIFESYLSFRQLKKHKIKEVPFILKDVITSKEFHDSQIYNEEKTAFGMIESFVDLIKTIFILYSSFLFVSWDSIEKILKFYFCHSEIITSLCFLMMNGMFEIIINIPFELYETFYIEEKYGFNKQTFRTYITDKIKIICIVNILSIFIVPCIIFIIRNTGAFFCVYIWLLFLLLSILMITIYPIWIAPWFNNFEVLSDGDLKEDIKKLCARVHFPLKKLYVMDGSKRSQHSNAYLYGFFNNKRIVLYDTLVEQMIITTNQNVNNNNNTEQKENDNNDCHKNDKILAVLAHELGHWKHKHTIFLFIFAQLHMILMLYAFTFFVHNDRMYEEFEFTKNNHKPVIIGIIIFFQFLLHPIDQVVHFLINSISRKFEYQADAFAVKLGYDRFLQQALIILYKENKGCLVPDPLYSSFHYSHPHLMERLATISNSKKKNK